MEVNAFFESFDSKLLAVWAKTAPFSQSETLAEQGHASGGCSVGGVGSKQGGLEGGVGESNIASVRLRKATKKKRDHPQKGNKVCAAELNHSESAQRTHAHRRRFAWLTACMRML